MKNSNILIFLVMGVSIAVFFVIQKASSVFTKTNPVAEKIGGPQTDINHRPLENRKLSDLQPSSNGQKNPAKSIRAEIMALESQLKQSNAIARLNDESVSPSERAQIFELLRNLDRLRADASSIEAIEIENEFARLESGFAARLKALGIQP